MSCSSNTGTRHIDRHFWTRLHCWILCALISCSLSGHSEATAAELPKHKFDLIGDTFAEVLRKFAVQTNLQLLYEQDAIAGQANVRLRGELSNDAALNRLLRNTGLRWRYVNENTVAIFRASAPPVSLIPVASDLAQQEPARPKSSTNGVVVLSDLSVTNSQPWWMNASSNTLGFDKPILDTPRSISYISGDAIDIFSLTAVEDLLRVVPGVFTTTRFGVQGSIDIRNVPADTYFRGMKRLTLQGHGRSVLAAMDSIEVVGGVTSPLYGFGKIGGYTNVVPKSGRARTGKYLEKPEGFVQLITGEYQRRELSFGFGGPLDKTLSFGKQGGFYLYGLYEDSGSYVQGVPIKQKLFQAATSINDMLGAFRLETGVNFQVSGTAGALTGRLTQALVDHGRYIGGSPLVNLDLNGNGRIGYLEMQSASPVQGQLTTYNQPLNQVFAWPTATDGTPLSIEQFPKVAGIPKTMYDYLQAHPEADPTGLLRAQGVGGPVPISGAVPVGMVLDPRTVSYTQYNPRHSAAFEKELEAKFLTAYLDMINDEDPDNTLKNQVFFDSMDQYKSSNQPFSQEQDVYVMEDKLTASHRLQSLPDSLAINSLMSINARLTVSEGKMTLADYGNHRTDATSASWNDDTAGMTSNTTFTSSNEVSTLTNDGLPWASLYRSQFSEFGVGALFDIDLFHDTNLLLGGRYDLSHARNTDYAGRFNINTGTAASPGAFINSDAIASGWDRGASWSASLSHAMPGGWRPYLTVSSSSIMLDANNNSLLNSVIRFGHIGQASLKEAGIKGSWLQGKLSFSTAFYQQGRIEVEATDDASVLNAYASATTTRGWQTEFRWAPAARVVLTLNALKQVTRYTPNIGGTIQVDARTLGFKDVLDANGNVVYPAEAFLYGGRARVLLPDNMKQYERKQGNPENQIGFTGIYQFARQWGATLKGNYLSSTCAGRLCLVHLPQSLVFDVGIYRSTPTLDLKLDVSNVGDKLYYRARTGDTLGDVIAQVMPGRRWQVTGKYKF